VLAYVVAWIVIGTRMRALANLLHESAHRKLFAGRRRNAIVGAACCAWPLGIPYRAYVRLHRLHHKNLWQRDGDPDVGLYRLTDTEVAGRGRLSFRRFLVRHVVLVVVPVVPLRRFLFDGAGRGRLVGLGAMAATAAVGAGIDPTAGQVILLYWLVPWLTTFQVFSYWAELGEHGGLRLAGWDWGSRNWSGSMITRWAIGSHSDDLYHLLHHWFPSVPHYRLRALDRHCQGWWEAYRSYGACGGFFVGSKAGPSVLRDIWDGGMRRGIGSVAPADPAGLSLIGKADSSGTTR
jgi:fatty acid desaturase